MDSKEKNLYKEVVEVFGIDFQKDMLIEECSEITKAIIKIKRRKRSISRIDNIPLKNRLMDKLLKEEDNYVEEFVDIEIVLSGLKPHLDKKAYAKWKEFKLNRLGESIEEEKLIQKAVEEKKKSKGKFTKKKGDTTYIATRGNGIRKLIQKQESEKKKKRKPSGYVNLIRNQMKKKTLKQKNVNS